MWMTQAFASSLTMFKPLVSENTEILILVRSHSSGLLGCEKLYNRSLP